MTSHLVGRDARELWVPAEELPDFNAQIVGLIAVEASFYGARFAGEVDPATGLPASLA